MYQYITKENVFKEFDKAETYTKDLTGAFDEYARIARNRPKKIDEAYPSVTDGTAASIVQKTPKRVVQQLPIGSVISKEENSFVDIIAEEIYTEQIMPNANEDFGLFEKSHLIIENGLSFGFGVSYTPFVNHSGIFTPDMTIPYWGDIFITQGKKSAGSSNAIFLRSWWQEGDIDRLIDSETKLQAQAKKRGEKYESTWDIKALEEVKQELTAKDEQAKTPSENERGVATEAIELITAFQSGVGAKFYTFNRSSQKIVRTKVNKDPRGKMPLDFFYGDIDGENPFGRGIIELIGGLQNLIDSDMQAHAFNRAYSMQPALQVYGNVPLSSVKMMPNALIRMPDPNGRIVPLTVDTKALNDYPQLYGLNKSQLLNLVNSPDTSISADVGNPGFGKTPQALKNQNAAISVDDNAIRKRFESWFQAWSETAINLFFAERTGSEVLTVSDKTADRLKQLVKRGEYELNPEAEAMLAENKVLVNYDEITLNLKFRIDAGSSKAKDDSETLESQMQLLQIIDGSPTFQQLIPTGKKIALYNGIVTNLALEDPENYRISDEDIKEMEQQAQMQAQAQAMPQEMPAEPLPETPAEQPIEQPTLSDQLAQLGFPPEVLMEVQQMQADGMSDDEITAMLMRAGASNER